MPASAILPFLVLLAQPQAARPDASLSAAAPESSKPVEAKKEDRKEEKEVPPVVTRHEMRAGGRLLKYTATTGLMPLRNETGELEANVFYVAYTLDRGVAPLEKRPLMFSFNGGPGSSSVWLHLGALGPLGRHFLIRAYGVRLTGLQGRRRALAVILEAVLALVGNHIVGLARFAEI